MFDPNYTREAGLKTGEKVYSWPIVLALFVILALGGFWLATMLDLSRKSAPPPAEPATGQHA